MDEVVEVARLVAVRVEPHLPWCVADPRRWAYAGAPGETTALTMSSYAREDGGRFLNYVLAGCTVTVSVYHDAYKAAPYPSLLRFDDKVSFPVNQRKLEGVSRRLFEEHPELRMRVGWDGKRASIPAHTAAYAAVTKGRARALDREHYPLVLVPMFSTRETEGIVLAEPVVLLHPRDLPCQADRLD